MDTNAVIQSIIVSVPEIIVTLGACVLLMISLLPDERQRSVLVGVSLAVIAAAAFATFALEDLPKIVYGRTFVIDNFAVYFKVLFYIATGLTVLMSRRYLEEEGIASAEYYVLLLFALVGMMIMVSGLDLLTIYLGMELQALSIYVLTGYNRRDTKSNEAALKFVILGAVSSGIFLYGLSLMYGLTGTTQLSDMAAAVTVNGNRDPALILAMMFLLIGLIFKVGVVPFHMWVPDVYEGAPTPVTAFMSVGPKAAAIAVVLRVFANDLVALSDIWVGVATFIAVLTMALGSFVALVQTRIKRLLAWSSIAHVGFITLGLVAGGSRGISSVMLYMMIYTFMNLGIFAVVITMRNGRFRGELNDDYSGLAKSNRFLALLMLIFLFSLAGIPPTAGFFAKFYVLIALIEEGYTGLAVVAVLLSAVAAYFYIRIVMIVYMRDPEGEFDLALTPSMRIVLAVTSLGAIVPGLLPGWFLKVTMRSVFPEFD